MIDAANAQLVDGTDIITTTMGVLEDHPAFLLSDDPDC